MQLKFELHGEVLKQFRSGEAVVKSEFKRGIQGAVRIVRKHVIAEAPKNEGGLQQSIRAEAFETRGHVYPTAKHAEFIYKGSKPHAAPYGAIKKWAERRGMNPGAVWMSIKRKGTKANKFLDRAKEASLPEFAQVVESVASAITKHLSGK